MESGESRGWNFKELLRNKLRFTWGWAEVHIAETVNWVAWPEVFSMFLLCVCIEISLRWQYLRLNTRAKSDTKISKINPPFQQPDHNYIPPKFRANFKAINIFYFYMFCLYIWISLWSDSRNERIVAVSENIKYFCYMKRNSSWEFFFNFVYFERGSLAGSPWILQYSRQSAILLLSKS